MNIVKQQRLVTCGLTTLSMDILQIKKKITSASGINPLLEDCHFKYFGVIGKSGACFFRCLIGAAVRCLFGEHERRDGVFSTIDWLVFVRSVIILLLSHHIMYEFIGLSNDVCNPVENQSSHKNNRISNSALNWTGFVCF